MAAKLALSSQFEEYGTFWKPENPDDKFTGRLAGGQRRIELTTSPEMKGFEHLPELLSFTPVIVDVLHGYTTKGPCTLFGLHSFHPSSCNLPIGIISFRTFRVDLCVFGLHIPDTVAPVLTSFRFSYSGLQEWIPKKPDFEITTEKLQFRFPKGQPPIFDVCSTEIRSRIELDVVPEVNVRFTGEIKSVNESQLTIEPAEPKSVDWFFEIGYHFQNFFSLLLGTSVRILSIATKSEDDVGWFINRDRNKIGKVDPSIWVKCNRSQLALAALKWVSASEELRPFENLVYGAIRNSSLYAETEFISLAQAIEVFHRITDPVTISASELFEEVVQRLEEATQLACSDLELQSRIMECIRHANDVTFQTRVKSLLARLGTDKCRALLGDPDDFERTLRQTRNYFTHLGIRKQTKVIVDGKELFLFNQKLHAFLRMLVLMRLGLPPDLIFEPVLSQSKKWR